MFHLLWNKKLLFYVAICHYLVRKIFKPLIHSGNHSTTCWPGVQLVWTSQLNNHLTFVGQHLVMNIIIENSNNNPGASLAGRELIPTPG